MRKHTTLGIGLMILAALWPVVSYGASSLTRTFPLGGRVVATREELQAAIVCTATYGPFMMLAFNAAAPGPYFIRATTHGTPKRLGYLLGNYGIQPDMETCYNPETGVPVPAFEIKLYGVSR